MSETNLIFLREFVPLVVGGMFLLGIIIVTAYKGIAGELEYRRFMKENSGTDEGLSL